MAEDAAQALNYLSVEAGAAIAEVTHEAQHMGSAAANLLSDAEDHLWIANAPPQHVTVVLGPHAPIRYVGWYVWHDYLTNPKTVEVSSGATSDELSLVTTCNAFPGAGVQLWELSAPIPTEHKVVRFAVRATFGGAYTYMNRLYAFSEHPGSRFAPKSASPRRSVNRTRTPERAAPMSPGGFSDIGSPHVSALLRELDHDIRALHPLRANAPPPLPVTDRSSFAHAHPPDDAAHMNRSEAAGRDAAEAGTSDIATAARVASLESSVRGLVQIVEAQAAEIRALREDLARSRPPTPQASRQHSVDASHQVSVGPAARRDFPEEALRAYVEDVMAPRLAKHSRRFEARVTQRMDEHLEELLRNVNAAVDERVSRHMRRIALSVDKNFSAVADGIRDPGAHHRPRR